MKDGLTSIEIGRSYDVPCAKLRWKEDGRIYHIPVLEHPHSDPELDFPHHHYHIDGRFEMHPRMQHRLEIIAGHTRAVILTGGSNSYDFKGLIYQNIKCERKETGLIFPGPSTSPERLALYKSWYAQYVGRLCKGRRCPHFGTQMLEREGKLICPMHHLTADTTSLQILPHVG